MATNFYKTGGSYYTADTNQKILNLTDLQKYAKAGGKEISAPTPTQGSTAIPNPQAIKDYNVTNNIGGTLYGTLKTPTTTVVPSSALTEDNNAAIASMTANTTPNYNDPNYLNQQAQDFETNVMKPVQDYINQINTQKEVEYANMAKYGEDYATAKADRLAYQTETERGADTIGNMVQTSAVAGARVNQYNHERSFDERNKLLAESNAATRLGLSQDQYKMLQTDQNMQMQYQGQLSGQKQKILDRANKLSDNQQNMMVGFVENLINNGVDINSLPANITGQAAKSFEAAGIPWDLVVATADAVSKQKMFDSATADKILSPTEAATLGVPYGTTQSQASSMNITPARWKGTSGSRGTSAPSANTSGVTNTDVLSARAKQVYDNPSLLDKYTPTQRGAILDEFANAGIDVSQFGKSSTISNAQKDDLAQMDTVVSLIDDILAYNDDGKLEGIGSFGRGSLYSMAGQLGLSSEEAMSVRALIGNIKGTIAKLRGGTSFTPNEEKLLESYTPSINDNPVVAINKLNLLKDFIDTRKETLYSYYGSSISSNADDLINKYSQ